MGGLVNTFRTLSAVSLDAINPGNAMSKPQERSPHGDIATIHGWPLKDDGVSIELQRPGPAATALEPLLWVDTRTLPPESRQEFWCEWHLGVPVWVRFRLVRKVFNRAVFQAVEVRLASASEPRPQGTWWPL